LAPENLHLASTLPCLPGFENDQEEGNHRLTGLPLRHTKKRKIGFCMLNLEMASVTGWILDPEAENCK
jgi:hypothetical protein